jgi:hypothetical protein
VCEAYLSSLAVGAPEDNHKRIVDVKQAACLWQAFDEIVALYLSQQQVNT